MHPGKAVEKNIYFTRDHEWIHFQGSIAYVGVGRFKLTGIKTIQQFEFNKTSGLQQQGTAIATIQYDDYKIAVNMPVTGEIIQVNEALTNDTQDTLLNFTETDGWIALIVPAQPGDKNHLLPPDQYKLTIERKM